MVSDPKAQGFDILLTHSPTLGLNVSEHISHRGFDCFNTLMDRYGPSCFIHGHVHRNYGIDISQKMIRGKTTVINAFEYCMFDLDR